MEQSNENTPCTCQLAIESRKTGNVCVWCEKHGSTSRNGKLLPMRTATRVEVIANPSLWGPHMSFKMIDTNGKSSWNEVKDGKLVRATNPPRDSRYQPKSPSPSPSLQNIIRQFNVQDVTPYVSQLSLNGQQTPPYSPRSPAPSVNSFDVLLDQAAELMEVDPITTPKDEPASQPAPSTPIPAQAGRPTNTPRVCDDNHPKRSPSRITTIDTRSVSSTTESSKSDTQSQGETGSCRCDKETKVPKVRPRITPEQISDIGSEIAVETLFDGFSVETLRTIRELSRRKANVMAVRITVLDITKIIQHVMDEHMVLVMETESWRRNNQIKWNIKHINNLSVGLFKVKDDDKFLKRIGESFTNMAGAFTSALGFSAPILPNSIPKSSF